MVSQPQTSRREEWGYRAVCWEQQRDLRAVNPATATQYIVSGYFVLSHLLPWLHCQQGFKDIWRVSVQAPENHNSVFGKNRPWLAASLAVGLVTRVTSQALSQGSPSSLWPVLPEVSVPDPGGHILQCSPQMFLLCLYHKWLIRAHGGCCSCSPSVPFFRVGGALKWNICV